MPTRSQIVRVVMQVAAAARRPLFVGNGFLAREVMRLASPGDAQVLPIQGGMGLAAGVAAGYLLAGQGGGAVVLEGDGNHVMGWGCAQFIGSRGLPIVHVVCLNGVYESAGGWPVPAALGLSTVAATATALGYERGIGASAEAELLAALRTAVELVKPSLIYVREDGGDDAPGRVSRPTAEYAQGFRGTGRPSGRPPGPQGHDEPAGAFDRRAGRGQEGSGRP